MGLQHPPNPGLCPARGPGPRRGAGAAARPQTLDGTRTPWHGGLPSGGGGGCRRKARGGGGVCVGERIYRPPPRPFPGRARGPGDAAPWGPWPVGSERGGADSGGAAPGGGGGGGGSAGSGPAAGRLRALRGRRSAPPKRCQRLRGRALRRGPPPGKQQATAAFPPTPVPLALGGGQWESCGPASSPPRTPGVPPLSTVPGQRSRPWAPGSPAG